VPGCTSPHAVWITYLKRVLETVLQDWAAQARGPGRAVAVAAWLDGWLAAV